MPKGLIYIQLGLLISLLAGCLPSQQRTELPVTPQSPSGTASASITPLATAAPSSPASVAATPRPPAEPGFASPTPDLVAQQPDCANPQTQIDMNACAAKSAEVADQALNESYQKLRATLQPEEEAALVDAQRAWIQFRDKNCEFSQSRFAGGSIAPMVYSSCIERITKQRTEELEGYGEGLEAGRLF